MDNKELQKNIEDLLIEVNRPLKVDSPLFFQKAYEIPEILSKCGRIWAKTKSNYEKLKLDFEIWESITELNIRSYHENVAMGKAALKEKTSRVTESQIQSEVKTDKEYKSKKLELIEAEELLNLAEKALYEACKLRGFVSQAIVRKTEG